MTFCCRRYGKTFACHNRSCSSWRSPTPEDRMKADNARYWRIVGESTAGINPSTRHVEWCVCGKCQVEAASVYLRGKSSRPEDGADRWRPQHCTEEIGLVPEEEP